jgi:hypothetical protein
MSVRTKALLGILGAVAMGVWIKLQRVGRAPTATLEPQFSASRPDPQWLFSIQIDDDTAAEIIKRARPALERARQSYGVCGRSRNY